MKKDVKREELEKRRLIDRYEWEYAMHFVNASMGTGPVKKKNFNVLLYFFYTFLFVILWVKLENKSIFEV